mmetsp:Transcript_168501/g.541517  ORF Transcript_168501/g.541517 Transcript_168501/m.541517 type:complete len:234 (-) Transcript_168501:121-822(-)
MCNQYTPDPSVLTHVLVPGGECANRCASACPSSRHCWSCCAGGARRKKFATCVYASMSSDACAGDTSVESPPRFANACETACPRRPSKCSAKGPGSAWMASKCGAGKTTNSKSLPSAVERLTGGHSQKKASKGISRNALERSERIAGDSPRSPSIVSCQLNCTGAAPSSGVVLQTWTRICLCLEALLTICASSPSSPTITKASSVSMQSHPEVASRATTSATSTREAMAGNMK